MSKHRSTQQPVKNELALKGHVLLVFVWMVLFYTLAAILNNTDNPLSLRQGKNGNEAQHHDQAASTTSTLWCLFRLSLQMALGCAMLAGTFLAGRKIYAQQVGNGGGLLLFARGGDRDTRGRGMNIQEETDSIAKTPTGGFSNK